MNKTFSFFKAGYYEWNLFYGDDVIYTVGDIGGDFEDALEIFCFVDHIEEEIIEYYYDKDEEISIEIKEAIRENKEEIEKLIATTFIDYYGLEDELYELLDRFLEKKDYKYDKREEEIFSMRVNFWSNCGEEIWEEYYGSDNSLLTFEDIIREIDDGLQHIYEYNFDVDEHVEMWISAKNTGTKGIPSVGELVDDAREIKEYLKEMAENFYDEWCKFYFEATGELYNNNLKTEKITTTVKELEEFIDKNNLKTEGFTVEDIKNKCWNYEYEGRQLDNFNLEDEIYNTFIEYEGIKKIVYCKDFEYKYNFITDDYLLEFNLEGFDYYNDYIYKLDNGEISDDGCTYSINYLLDTDINKIKDDLKGDMLFEYEDLLEEYNYQLEKISNNEEYIDYNGDFDNFYIILENSIESYKNIEKTVDFLEKIVAELVNFNNYWNSYYNGEDIDVDEMSITLYDVNIYSGKFSFDNMEVM